MRERTLKDKGYAGYVVSVEVKGKHEFLKLGNKVIEFEEGTAREISEYLHKKLGLRSGFGMIYKKGLKGKDVRNAINTDNKVEKEKKAREKKRAEIKAECQVIRELLKK